MPGILKVNTTEDMTIEDRDGELLISHPKDLLNYLRMAKDSGVDVKILYVDKGEYKELEGVDHFVESEDKLDEGVKEITTGIKGFIYE